MPRSEGQTDLFGWTAREGRRKEKEETESEELALDGERDHLGSVVGAKLPEER